MMLGHGNIEGKEVMVEERAGKEIVEVKEKRLKVVYKKF